MIIARPMFGTNAWGPLLVFFVECVLLVGTVGSTIGHAALGLRVQTVDGRAAGPITALVRSALLCLLIPAVVWDRDQRGLHDKAAGTVIVRQ